MFDYEKTEKFYDFEDINTANGDSVSGKTIKPVLKTISLKNKLS